MTSRLPPTDMQLMMLSAYLDGELSPAEESQVLDALSQNPLLLDAMESLAALRLPALPSTSTTTAPTAAEADALVASVMAATAPEALPATLDGARQLAQLAFDGQELPAAALEALAQPGADHAVAGFLAAGEATQAALRAVAAVPSVVAGLRAVPDHVDARLAARERFGVLASARLDDALSPAEAAELDGLFASPLCGDPDEVPALQGAVHFAEALRAASAAPAFARLGARAGDAALHAIDAERARAAAPVRAGASARLEARSLSLFDRVGALFSAVRAPLAFAGAAFALFFVVGRTVTEAPGTDLDTAAATAEILAAWERKLVSDTGADQRAVDLARADGDLPLLADNSADVEAIDAAGTTVVFATESSNITVIWVDAEEDT